MLPPGFVQIQCENFPYSGHEIAGEVYSIGSEKNEGMSNSSLNECFFEYHLTLSN